jgi:hypothetical protein
MYSQKRNPFSKHLRFFSGEDWRHTNDLHTGNRRCFPVGINRHEAEPEYQVVLVLKFRGIQGLSENFLPLI